MAEQGESDAKGLDKGNNGHFSKESEVPTNFDMKNFV
jgi:hypothetical protein